MRPLFQLRRSIASIAVACLCSCSAVTVGGHLHPRSPHYSIGFANDSDAELHDVEAKWKVGETAYRSSAGVLIPGGEKMNSGEFKGDVIRCSGARHLRLDADNQRGFVEVHSAGQNSV